LYIYTFIKIMHREKKERKKGLHGPGLQDPLHRDREEREVALQGLQALALTAHREQNE